MSHTSISVFEKKSSDQQQQQLISNQTKNQKIQQTNNSHTKTRQQQQQRDNVNNTNNGVSQQQHHQYRSHQNQNNRHNNHQQSINNNESSTTYYVPGVGIVPVSTNNNSNHQNIARNRRRDVREEMRTLFGSSLVAGSDANKNNNCDHDDNNINNNHNTTTTSTTNNIVCYGDFLCHYQKITGRLYLSSRYVLFYSMFLGFERKLSIPYDHITHIELFRTTSIRIYVSSVIPTEAAAAAVDNNSTNEIIVNKYVFKAFENREHVLNLIRQRVLKSLSGRESNNNNKIISNSNQISTTINNSNSSTHSTNRTIVDETNIVSNNMETNREQNAHALRNTSSSEQQDDDDGGCSDEDDTSVLPASSTAEIPIHKQQRQSQISNDVTRHHLAQPKQYKTSPYCTPPRIRKGDHYDETSSRHIDRRIPSIASITVSDHQQKIRSRSLPRRSKEESGQQKLARSLTSLDQPTHHTTRLLATTEENQKYNIRHDEFVSSDNNEKEATIAGTISSNALMTTTSQDESQEDMPCTVLANQESREECHIDQQEKMSTISEIPPQDLKSITKTVKGEQEKWKQFKEKNTSNNNVSYPDIALDNITLSRCSDVDSFYNMFISNNAQYPIEYYQTNNIGDKNIITSPWKASIRQENNDNVMGEEESERNGQEEQVAFSDCTCLLLERTIQFVHPVRNKNMLGPSSVEVSKKQILHKFGNAGMCINTSTIVSGVPSSDAFTVEDQWIIEPAGLVPPSSNKGDREPNIERSSNTAAIVETSATISSSSSSGCCEGGGGVTLTVRYDVRFTKSSMLKKIIKKSTRTENTEWYRGYANMLNSALEEEETKKQKTKASALQRLSQQQEVVGVQVNDDGSAGHKEESSPPATVIAGATSTTESEIENQGKSFWSFLLSVFCISEENLDSSETRLGFICITLLFMFVLIILLSLIIFALLYQMSTLNDEVRLLHDDLRQISSVLERGFEYYNSQQTQLDLVQPLSTGVDDNVVEGDLAST